MKCCIFVDGENLRHSIVKLFSGEFDKKDYLPKRARWQELFDWLAGAADGGDRLRTYWYTIEHLDFRPWLPLPTDIDILRKVLCYHGPNRRRLEELDVAEHEQCVKQMAKDCYSHSERMRRRFDGWKKIQDDIAQHHDAVEFRRAGAITYNLFDGSLGQEKAVDVKLAADLIQLRDIYDTAVIVSGDQDYVPAVEVVKDSGKRVINVAFLGRNGKLLPGGARRLNQKTDAALTVPYDELKTYLGI